MSSLSPAKSRWYVLAELLVPLFFFAIIGSVLVARVWVHYRIMSLEYEASDLLKERHELLLTRTGLEREIEEYRDPDRLKTAALRIHHMEPPRADQIIKSDGKMAKEGQKTKTAAPDVLPELEP